MRIAVIGGTIWGNRGAEAMLESVVGRLRAALPGTGFDIYSYYPNRDTALVDNSAVAIMSCTPAALVLRIFPAALWVRLWSLIGLRWPAALLPRSVARLRECEILIDIAGVSFSDGREKFLPFNILCIWPAILMGVTVVKCSQAMGPFTGALNRLAAKIFLSRCRLIFGRGRETMSHLTGLGLKPGLTAEAPDLAFAHQPEFALSHENDRRVSDLLNGIRRGKAAGRPLLCISPSALVASKCRACNLDYAAALARIARAALERGHDIVVLPTASRESDPSGTRNNDLLVVRDIADAIGPDQYEGRVHWVDWDMNFASVKSCMVEADAAVVSRFHALVAALSLGVPTLALGWGHKYGELLGHFGLEAWSVDFADLNEAELKDEVFRLLAEKDMLRRNITASLPRIAAETDRQFEKILELLKQ